MAKNPPPSVTQLSKESGQLMMDWSKETDRGLALVAAAFIDADPHTARGIAFGAEPNRVGRSLLKVIEHPSELHVANDVINGCDIDPADVPFGGEGSLGGTPHLQREQARGFDRCRLTCGLGRLGASGGQGRILPVQANLGELRPYSGNVPKHQASVGKASLLLPLEEGGQAA